VWQKRRRLAGAGRLKKFQKAIKENPHYLSSNFGGIVKDSGGLTEYGISIYETVSEIQPFAVH
ncbi:TPA: hypothetical protein ACG0M0_005848, partial [Escherichia coli]